MSLLQGLFLMALLLVPSGFPARADAPPGLPPGVTAAQYDWLLRLGAAKSPETTEFVLKERTDGASVLRAMAAGIPQFPSKIGSEWLAANPGLIVLSEHMTDQDLSGVGLMGAGLVAHRNRRFDEAAALYERARVMFIAVGDARGVCQCCLHEASLGRNNGDIPKWEAAARDAVRFADRTKDPQVIMDASFNLMESLRVQKRFPEALAVMEKARAEVAPLGNFRSMYDATFDCILVLRDLHRYEDALPLAQQLSESTDHTGNAEIIWRAYSYWGYTLKDLQRYPESIAVFQKVISILKPLGDEDDIALATNQIADNSQGMGDNDNATRYFRQALPVMERHIDDPGVAWQVAFALQYLSQKAILSGQLDEALLDVLTMLKAAENTRQIGWTGRDYQLMADILKRTGHLPEALACQKKVLALAEADPGQPKTLVSMLVNNLGGSYQDMGDYPSARRSYERALSTYLGLHDEVGVADSYLHLADLDEAEGHPDRALADLDKAEKALKQAPDQQEADVHSDTRSAGQIKAIAYLALGRPQDALALEDACMAEAERTGENLDVALAVKAQAQARTGRTGQAIATCRRLIALRQNNPADDPEWANLQSDPAEALLARLLIGKADLAGAFQAAQDAKGVSVRRFLLSDRAPDTSLPREQTEQLRTLRAAYEQASHGASSLSPDAARDQALTQLTTFEMSLRARYPRWGASQVRPARLDEIARSLGPTSAILEMMVDDTHISLLVLRNRNGQPALTGRIVALPKGTFISWIRQVVTALQTPRPDPRLLDQLLRRLYGYTIQPVEGDLAGVHTLILCPDRYLHAIPFAALEDAKGNYLIQKMALTISPSASAWQACRSVASSRETSRTSAPLLAAVSRFGAKARVASVLVPKRAMRGTEVADLPGVVGESHVVERAFRDKVITLLEKDATVEAVKRAAKDASVLHLATHAFANDDAPMMGSLLLSPSPQNPSGLLYARDILDIPLHAKLAVLSACDTNEGSATGEGLVGLAWAFMVAGCPSTIGSRWDVDDGAAQQWMAAFYRSYTSRRASVAESRRDACLALLATKGKRDDYSAPRFWANWTLLGSDR